MNPADYKHFGPGQDPSLLPLTVGYEAAGVISAVGPVSAAARLSSCAAPRAASGQALDCVGTGEAIDVSLVAVPDTKRIVSTAAFDRAPDAIQLTGAANPLGGPFRASQRARLLALAADGQLTVPIARAFPMDEAPAAVAGLMGRHPYGKLALVA